MTEHALLLLGLTAGAAMVGFCLGVLIERSRWNVRPLQPRPRRRIAEPSVVRESRNRLDSILDADILEERQ